jgi:hypothetical protein
MVVGSIAGNEQVLLCSCGIGSTTVENRMNDAVLYYCLIINVKPQLQQYLCYLLLKVQRTLWTQKNKKMANKYLEDLSYSGLTKIIQSDREIGKKCLIEIVKESEKYKKQYNDLAEKMQRTSVYIGLLNSGLENVIKHLKIDTPISIISEKEVIDIDNCDGQVKGYKIKTNIL